MELKLDEISRGELTPEKFLSDTETLISSEVGRIKALPPIPDTERFKDNKVFMAHSCPKCGADVVETEKMIVCRNNCGFKVWRTIASKKIPKTVIKTLIETGMTDSKVEGLKKKGGKEPMTPCWFYIDADSYEVKFDFSDDAYKAKKNNFKIRKPKQ